MWNHNGVKSVNTMISYLHGSGVYIAFQFQAQYDMCAKGNIVIYPPGAVPQFTGGFHCAKICSGPARVTVVCKGAVGFVWPAHIFSCQSIFTWWLPSARWVYRREVLEPMSKGGRAATKNRRQDSDLHSTDYSFWGEVGRLQIPSLFASERYRDLLKIYMLCMRRVGI